MPDHNHISDQAARELLLAAAINELRAALAPIAGQRWERLADSVRNSSGQAMAWQAATPGGAAALDWMAAADPATVGLLLDELERLRAEQA